VSKDVAARKSKDRQQQRELIHKELTELASREQRLAVPRPLAVIEEELKRSQPDVRCDRSRGCMSASRSD
jgi:hypothetical protein